MAFDSDAFDTDAFDTDAFDFDGASPAPGGVTEITTTSTITDILGIIGSVVLMLMGVN